MLLSEPQFTYRANELIWLVGVLTVHMWPFNPQWTVLRGEILKTQADLLDGLLRELVH